MGIDYTIHILYVGTQTVREVDGVGNLIQTGETLGPKTIFKVSGTAINRVVSVVMGIRRKEQ